MGFHKMATPCPLPVTAAQVGTYFVERYYQVIIQQPHLVHQFYSDASTMVRVDGSHRETAATMLQIHALVMSLNFTGIEIKTACSLESWNAGVLVMVSGSVLVKDFCSRRKFVQTIFLAPQQKGFFVLNDIFHFIEEQQIQHHSAVLLSQHNLNHKLNASATIPEPVPGYLLGGDIQRREFVAPVDVKENGPVDNYTLSEQIQQALESESLVDKSSVRESNGSLLHTVNTVQEHVLPVEEPFGGPQKHTYASVLRVAKGQPAPSVAPQVSVSKNSPPASDWDHAPQHTTQQPVLSSNVVEMSGADMVDETSPIEYEGEIKSVYVRNLPSTVSESEIEEEFKKFGEISPDGVVIRSRKDVGVCYAFVEFEDMSSVCNAVMAGTAQVAGRLVYIEERRPNSYIPSRGGRMGTGRGSYPTEAPGGRFGTRSYGRGGVYNGSERDHSRSRRNGFCHQTTRQDRGLSGQQAYKIGQSS
ncbi:hypothetical protein J1N35_037327 [Gossypium stocksii]|uniref:G3BP-like protein n=1 Tax=Gossypium stocksii TaxID=47602 RepID=A0A9D3UJY0_9ROSI|nr:hypothetical protein J1N35_037327 [Gossypium stocksii]